MSPDSSAAAVFAALGDDTRLSLVKRLCESGPSSLTHLAEGADVTRQAITKHLHVLEGAGLVRGSRHGRTTVWELRPKRLDAAKRALEVIARDWDAALGRLRDLVEDDDVR